MFQRMEDACDRASLVRMRVACPKMQEADVQAFWDALVKLENRAYARYFLDKCLDIHERAVAQGQPGMFDEYGELIEAH